MIEEVRIEDRRGEDWRKKRGGLDIKEARIGESTIKDWRLKR